MQRIACTLVGGLAALALSTPAAHAAVTATSDPAGSVSATGATLNGTLFSSLLELPYRFEYGPTAALGSTTPQRMVPAFLPYSVSETLTGLRPDTTYHYRLVGLLGSATSGAVRTLTTTAAPVTTTVGSLPAVTSAGTAVRGTGVTLLPRPSNSPTNGPQPSAPADSPSQLPSSGQPRSGKAVAVARGRGTVLVKPRGANRYSRLDSGTVIPMGSLVDTTAGSVALTAELPSGRRQTGTFSGGLFSVTQGRDGYVDLALRGPVCTTAPRTTRRKLAKRAVASAAGRERRRRLFGRDRGGRFRTHGRHSQATVRGTRWLVEDRCDGTLTTVSEGAVEVRDFATNRRVLVRAGGRYLARARR